MVSQILILLVLAQIEEEKIPSSVLDNAFIRAVEVSKVSWGEPPKDVRRIIENLDSNNSYLRECAQKELKTKGLAWNYRVKEIGKRDRKTEVIERARGNLRSLTYCDKCSEEYYECSNCWLLKYTYDIGPFIIQHDINERERLRLNKIVEDDIRESKQFNIENN